MFFVFELKCMKLFLFRAVRYFFKIMYFVFINTKKTPETFFVFSVSALIFALL
jgi:hypothetical protein